MSTAFRQQQSFQQSLSPLDVKGTLSILHPELWHLSPCWGAALSSSPAIGNLLRLGLTQNEINKINHFQFPSHFADAVASSDGIASTDAPEKSGNLSQVAKLATLLLFQGRDRYQPVRPIRTKSMAAAYLTPERIGMILGLTSLGGHAALDDKLIKRELKRVGINKSNHVDGKWTGVSLARWKELIQLSSMKSHRSDHLTRSLWLYVLWNTARNKRELLDFFLELEKQLASSASSSREQESIIFNPKSERAQALHFDPVAREEWCVDCFRPEDLGQQSTQNAPMDLKNYGDLIASNTNDAVVIEFVDQLLAAGSMGIQSAEISAAAALQLELSCARWAMRYSTDKPAIRVSKYSIDDAKIKPDCVEMTVREVMDLLVWDGWTWNIDRLPDTAHPDLIHIYKIQQNQRGNIGIKKACDSASGTRETSSTKQQQIQNEANTHDIGQLWFELLSNIPACSYLSQSPKGNPYELTPTLANVAEATRFLLLGCDKTQQFQQHSLWTSMQDVAKFWNSNGKRNLPYVTGNDLVVSSRIHSFRQAMGDEVVHQEIAILSITDNNTTTSIELRLDKAHRTSSVTHLCNRNSAMHQSQDLETMHRKCRTLLFRNIQEESIQDNRIPGHLWIENFSFACSSELIDKGNFLSPDNLHPKFPNPSFQSNLPDYLLSTRFGADRRLLVAAIESTDLTLRQHAARKAYISSCDTLLNAIRLGCRVCTMDACGEDERQQSNQVLLLSWLLLEDPTIISDQERHSNRDSVSGPSTGSSHQDYWKQVENALVDELPSTLLKNDTIRSAIRHAGDIHGSVGELTLRRLDVQIGDMSVWESCRGLTYAESFHLLRKLLL